MNKMMKGELNDDIQVRKLKVLSLSPSLSAATAAVREGKDLNASIQYPISNAGLWI
jgi:hypothetical protein